MLGWTVGEESILDKNFLCRIENCYCETDCALLEVSKSNYEYLKEIMVKEGQLKKDFGVLET